MVARLVGASVLAVLLVFAFATSAGAQQPSPGGPNAQVSQYAPPTGGPTPPDPPPIEVEEVPPEVAEPIPATFVEQGCGDVASAAAPGGVEDQLAFTGFGLLALIFVGAALLLTGLTIYALRRSRLGFELGRVPLALVLALVVAASVGSALAISPSSVLGIDLAQSEDGSLPGVPGPVVGETVNLVPCGANATVKTPGAGQFEEVGLPEQVPIGTVVNARRTAVVMVSATGQQTAASGEGALTASTDDGEVSYELVAVTEGATRAAKFSEGKFKILQKKTGRAVTEARMNGNLRGCKPGDDVPAKKRGRTLWGNGEGLHRVRGALASATVRGTKFRVKDLCDGATAVKVAQGKVSVKNLEDDSTKLLNAGESTRIEGP